MQVNLAEQGMLLRQQDFLVWQGRRKCLRRVFLFEELLVFSKAKHMPSGEEVYQYKSSIKVCLVLFSVSVSLFNMSSGSRLQNLVSPRMSATVDQSLKCGLGRG
jgi:hypothetical protein